MAGSDWNGVASVNIRASTAIGWLGVMGLSGDEDGWADATGENDWLR